MRKSLVPLPFQSLRLERILWDGEKKRNESMGRPNVYGNRDQGLNLGGYRGQE